MPRFCSQRALIFIENGNLRAVRSSGVASYIVGCFYKYVFPLALLLNYFLMRKHWLVLGQLFCYPDTDCLNWKRVFG